MPVSYEAWYPREAKASHHGKLIALRAQYGWEAEGWFWHLLGELRESKSRSIEWHRPFIKSSLANFFNTTIPHLENVVHAMCNGLELLEMKDGDLICPGLQETFDNLDTKHEQTSLAGRQSAESKKNKKIYLNERSTTA